jgi:hypothetical protein
MKMGFEWRYAFVMLAICMLVSLAVASITGLKFWPVLAVTIIAVLANGLIASRR